MTHLALLLLCADGPARPEKVDFNRDVRPILAETCFTCHGPDPKARKAKLRLDAREEAVKSGVLVPGKADASEAFTRLVHDDPAKRMPPPKFLKQLTPAQVTTLRRWIDQGAPYAEHWAFVPPSRPPLPAVSDPAWARTPVDRFALARLDAERLRPSPEASRAALLRRVTFDLTGLPPTPAELDAFLADAAAGAYERAVDRLLDSPRYGEHQARYWLDLARFGDTHGLHLDNYREMHPYRDWVIRAFNENRPYDAFLRAQLAGDLLPGGTLDDLVATGFNRAHVTTSEGGSITEEIHVRNVNDRVDTFGTALLGLSVGCAKCHDHKYDPITMKDFYALSGFFNSLEGNPLDGNLARHPPTVPVPTAEQKGRLADLDARLAAARKGLTGKAATLVYDGTADAKEAEGPRPADFVWIDDALPAGVTADVGGTNRPWDFVAGNAQRGTKAVKLAAEGLGQVVFSGANPGLTVGAGDSLFAHVFLDPKAPPKEIMLQWHTAGWTHRAYWGENRIDWGRDGSTERRRLGDLPKAGAWARLEVPIAQVGIKTGVTINGLAFTQHGGVAFWDNAGLVTRTPQGAADATLAAWVRSVKAAKPAGLPADVSAAVNAPREKRTAEQAKRLRTYFVENVWREGKALLAGPRAAVSRLEADRKAVEDAVPVTYVFKETAAPRQAYLLKRGEYDQRGDPVGRAVPAFLRSGGEVRTRLQLADWLLAEKNPLTARVAVNRFWQQLFGTGLVKTSEEFGVQGEAPSHPELLDWLAVEFRESGWDVKRLLRLMVTSAVYRQSARLTRELATKDVGNRLLARGPRFRLDAEMLRDQVLFVSGLMAERMGGPSVKPPQPAGLWKAVAYPTSTTANFVADAGEKVYRRGLYTFWKRTSPPPQMTTFDAPSRESCLARRERTNTPLQALLLLNDPQYVEAARVLAQRSLAGAEGDAAVIAALFRRATSRPPEAAEAAELRATLVDLRAEYRADPAAARRLLAVGATRPADGVAAEELAAWTMLASTVLNLDEVLNK